MNPLQPQGLRRADYLERPGTLAVVRPTAPKADLSSAPANLLEPYILVAATGEVTAFNGHVDLGTGIRTALAQIVAEELDVAFERIVMLLGDTDVAPDQGPTIASETIQLSAIPLRRAAAQARQFLVARAAETLTMSASDLIVEDGVVRSRFEDNRRIAYGALIGAERIRLALADDVPVKTVSEHRIVGSSRPRVDLPAKATGALVFVHDMRVEGMLHGRVVRPPYAGFDSGEHVGRSLIRVDETSIAHLPGVVSTVVEGDFIGIVAEREEQAEAAMRALKVEWRETPKPPSLDDIAAALTSNPSRPRMLLDKGDVDGAIAAAAKRLTRAYVWPFQLHGSIGPSAALADVGPHGARIWSGTQNPLWMRRDLALLLDLPENAIDVIRMEAAGCYGRNGADDATADAALLSRAVGRPVRVQLTRDQEHQWEPKGAGQLMNVDGGLDMVGGVAAYDFATRYPSNAAPTLALLLTGRISPIPAATDMGDRTAIGPYDFANHRVTVHDMVPIARAAWLRGVSALPNTFAHESYIDELASEAGVDPVAYRLRYLRDPRGVDLIKQVAAKVGWEPRTGARKRRDEGGNLIGQGFGRECRLDAGRDLYTLAGPPRRKINLNYPLPVSNDCNEPIRQKWISDTYQLLKCDPAARLGRHGRGTGAAQPVRDQHHRLPRPGRHDDPLGQPGRLHHPEHFGDDQSHTQPGFASMAPASCSTSTAWSTTRSRSTRCWRTPSRAGRLATGASTYTNRFFIELVNTLTAAYNPTYRLWPSGHATTTQPNNYYGYGPIPGGHGHRTHRRQHSKPHDTALPGQRPRPGRLQLRDERSLLRRLLGPGLPGRYARGPSGPLPRRSRPPSVPPPPIMACSP